MGSFVCERCGKEFAHYTKSKSEKNRKYCKECYEKLYRRKTGAGKDKAKKVTRYCVDCGAECVILNKNDFKTCRCPACQEKRNNESKRKYDKRKKE